MTNITDWVWLLRFLQGIITLGTGNEGTGQADRGPDLPSPVVAMSIFVGHSTM